ncbi:phosphatase PAP2 family protein [Alteromonas pelagimontana]|uniref:undecaprenyl-diphosphate phosphatase n=1 Tax=Alteromonas pelagimontana TaxID=1858656 RepID=A0A6M4MBF3_9ALTE|nr:phosphatase PAP2 family protein [Alteromonas pelagimontana]QJR80357.1 phosphatase PAP2 family protein [Alteromonas pelagimontana]
MAQDKRRLFTTQTFFLMWLFFGLVWLFVHLAMTVAAGETWIVDEAIMLGLRNPQDLSDPIGPTWVEEIMRDATALGSNWLLVLMSGVIGLALGINGRPRLGWFLVSAILSGMLVSFLLKYGFTRPRPDLVPHHTRIYTSSFPSGHAMMSALTYFTLATLVAQIQPRRAIKILLFSVALLLAVMVGSSRVYLGVHWPSDIVAGWCAGGFWALLCHRVGKFFNLQGQL